MDVGIETKISQLIEHQFPAFYRDEGPVFIEFVKAYYAWMEETGNTINLSRTILRNRDVDDTLEQFLIFFQKKYLYGIPFNVIVNKRLLLKHVLDVYRSKGSLQCYKLLFRLIYNEDMYAYIPGNDILRVSDGTWKQPTYLEVTDTESAKQYVGKTIYGVTSKTTAIVESYTQETINKSIITTLYISNISPRRGSFKLGERVIDYNDITANNLTEIIYQSPAILGSLDTVQIVDGGKNFQVGDILKIADTDPDTRLPISKGKNGAVKVTTIITTGNRTLSFSIANSGYGYTSSALTFTYNNQSDTTGSDASFQIGNIFNSKNFVYNTDVICNYMHLGLDAVEYGFPGYTTGNLTNGTIGDMLSYSSNNFGKIASLDNIRSGRDYTNTATTFVKEVIFSEPLLGNVSYSASNNTIIGDGTNFDYYFTNNSVISVTANSSVSGSQEYHVIKNVVSNTEMEIYDTFQNDSTGSAIFQIGVDTLDSNYTFYDDELIGDPLITANVSGIPVIGNNIITGVTAIDSGKGYIDGETLRLYLTNCIEIPTIVDGGENYANGELLAFYGGNPQSYPEGTITTDANGTITLVSLTFPGSGFTFVPEIQVKTANGSGAILTTTVKEYDTTYEVFGTAVKRGNGKARGYWSTTRGFLNSDKYIQDSYYYQDFSYEINTALTLKQYESILYDTFHIAGTALFGRYTKIISETNIIANNSLSVIEITS